MKIDTKPENLYKTVALCSATLVLFGGLIFLLSWHLGYLFILKMPPSIAEPSYASCINIILSALGIFALFLPTRIPFANIFGGMILFITLWRIAELTFDLKFGLTEIIAPLIPLREVTITKMPGIITIGFILIGFVLLGWTRYNRTLLQSTITLLTSLVVFFLGAAALLNYFIPIKLSFIWRGTPLNFYTQCIAMLIGIGLAASCLYDDCRLQTKISYRLPIIVSIIIFLTSILFAWSFALEKATYIAGAMNSRLNEIKTRTKAYLGEEDIILLTQLASSMESDKNHSLAAREATISSYLQTQKELRAVLWISSEMIIRSIIPLNKFQEKLNAPFVVSSEAKQALNTAIAQKKIFIVPIFDQADHSYDLYVSNPVYWDQTFQGLLVFVVGLQKFFDLTITDIIKNNFAITIHIDDKKVFAINDKGLDEVKHWEIHSNLPIENLNYEIKIYPTPQFLDLYTNKTFIYMLVLGGFASAITLGTLIHLWQLSNAKIIEIEKFRKQLIHTQDEQRAALESAHMGTWYFDVKSYILTWDDYSHVFLYGLKPGELLGATWEEFLKKIAPEDREDMRNYLKSCIERQLLSITLIVSFGPMKAFIGSFRKANSFLILKDI